MRRVLDGAYSRAQEILRTHRDELETVARELLARESLTVDAFEALLEKRVA
ncbi:ATP-dependent zinc metalloprotease FtsH [compost metagenome]